MVEKKKAINNILYIWTETHKGSACTSLWIFWALFNVRVQYKFELKVHVHFLHRLSLKWDQKQMQVKQLYYFLTSLFFWFLKKSKKYFVFWIILSLLWNITIDLSSQRAQIVQWMIFLAICKSVPLTYLLFVFTQYFSVMQVLFLL